MGAGLTACGLLRHRLGAVALSRARRRVAADHRLFLRRRRWSMARSSFGTMPTKAAFRPGISNTGCRSRRNATAKSCGLCVKEAGAERRRGRQGNSRARLTLHGTAPSQPQGSPGLQGGAEGDRGRRARSSQRGLDAYRAGPDRAAQTLALHHLLERQHYKLGHWRLASSDINYRRFFDVNSLAGLRVEDAGTFEPPIAW